MGGNRAKPDESDYTFAVLWSTAVARQTPRTRRHTKNTYASETPVTDGTHVFGSFGSAGLYGLDFEGRIVWQRDLGLLRGKRGWGTGASPVLFEGNVIVQADSDDASYLAAFGKTAGDPVWRTEHQEGASWGTPFLFEAAGRMTIVTNATHRMRGYEATTGKLLWECGGGSMISVPSPIAVDPYLYVPLDQGDPDLL